MKENKILISILVPTYNRVEYLEECLDSIVEQEGFDLKELELIVSDNSEGNETKSFMNNYIQKHKDWNIKYNKNEKNLGMVGNWNKLLEIKKGEYYIFLSDDDKFYDKGSLKLLYNNLLKYNLDVCYGKYRVIDGNGNDKGDFEYHSKIGDKQIYYDSFNEQMKGHSISFGGILYKDFGYKYDYRSKWLSDWHMNLIYLYHLKKIGLINFYTFHYRMHDSNDSKQIPPKFGVKFLWYRCIYFKTYKYLFKETIRGLKFRLGNFIKIIKKGFISVKYSKHKNI